MKRVLSGKSIVVLAFCIAFLVCAAVFSGAKTNAKETDLLFKFKSAPSVKSADKRNSPASVKETDIRFNFESLRAEDLKQLRFPLFDGKTYVATQRKSEGFENRGTGRFTWRGKINIGKFSGDVTMTKNGEFVTGLIFSPAGVYEIAAIGNRQILIQLDQSLFPECAGEVNAPDEPKESAPENFGTVPDSGDRIDVLVVYTAAVKNAVGGEAQAETLAQNAVDISNTAYLNSKIRQRLRLVHVKETELTEANSLSQLRADAATQTIRNTHNADMVAMLVNSLSGCGIGYLMSNVSSGFESSAYTITLRTCAVGNLTFAHELGHNMGSTHDPANGSGSAFPYSYGHFVNDSYRTVMSYSSECSGGCTRVPQFSNPAVVFNGVPSGILNSRNNARSIENTADVVSNFRYSGSSLRLDNFSENAFIPRNISRTINWSSNNVSGNVGIEISRDEGTTWETVVADTANDGSETIRVGGSPTKRVRLRVSNLTDELVRDSSVRNISIK